MRSICVVICATLLLAFLLSGCSEDSQEITIIGENAANLKALQAMKGGYEDLSGTTITFRPHSFEDAFRKANQDLAEKTGLYDIIMQYNFSLSSFVRNSYVYTLDELDYEIPDSLIDFEQNLFQNAWKEVGFYYKDPSNPPAGLTKVGYPFGSNTMILAYNRDLFEDETQKAAYRAKYGVELSPPNTWGDYKNIAEFFTQESNSTYGVCLQGAVGSWLYYEWCNFVFGMGGSVMEKNWGWEGDVNTPVTIDSPEAVEATKLYVSLRPYNAGNFETIGAYEQLRMMKEGNIAMAIMWSDLLFELIAEDGGRFDNRFGFVPIPGNVSGLAGGSFFINRQSRSQKEALNYIIWVMQEENQVELVKRGLCSALRTAYDDPGVRDIPYTDALQKSLDRGAYMFEAGPDADMISHKITTYVQRMWNGEISVEAGLLQAKKEIEEERVRIFQALD